jgi:uracil-DNA glycosylase
MSVTTLVGESWAQIMGPEFTKPYMRKIYATLKKEREEHTVYPNHDDLFKAYRLTPYDKIRVVIVGQDPYHNGYADGLAFSSNDDKFVPQSLRNIFKEIGYKSEDSKYPCSSNLERWANQGVFLLNTCLSVRKGLPNSHSKIGWQEFTFKTIQALSERKERIFFMLWGAHARKYSEYIDLHHVTLEAAHPSPFSADKGFFGCGHFEFVNFHNRLDNMPEINW